MKTFPLLIVGALVVSGCDSEVVGGGGGAGGAGDGGATTAPATTSAQSAGGSTAETGSVGTTGPSGSGGAGGEDTSSVSAGGGGGGENLLGECVQDSGTAASSGSAGGTSCDAEFTCDAGAVVVSCYDDGTTETCECSLDEGGGSGSGGTCDNTASQGCGFPQSCCYELLGGHAEPNVGPYGACEDAGGSSAQSGGGTTACGTSWTCDGGDMMIDCEGDANGAVCECRDDQFFTIGTCRQATVDCTYESSCCYDVFNP